MLAVLLAYLLAADLTAPLRAIAAAVDRASAGDLSTPIVVAGRGRARPPRRQPQPPRRGPRAAQPRARPDPRGDRERLAARQPGVHRRPGRRPTRGRAFGMIDADVLLVDPSTIADGGARSPASRCRSGPILRVGGEELGVLVGHLPATRRWERGRPGPPRAVRERDRGRRSGTPSCSPRSSRRTPQLLELDAAKDDFLRGVSHNLQTPLTSIRAYADQLDAEPAGPPARRSSPSSPTASRGWSASC